MLTKKPQTGKSESQDNDLAFWDSVDHGDSGQHVSPYRMFSTADWAEFRADTPLTLSAGEVERLRSLNDPISLKEVERIYLSLSRLLSSGASFSTLKATRRLSSSVSRGRSQWENRQPQGS